MSIVHAIPELWRAGLLRQFDKQSIWAGLCTDLSSEFGDGDTLHLNEVTGTITVRDYVVGTALEDPETADDTDLTLTINRQKYINLKITDVERTQSRPKVFEEYVRQGGAKLASTFDRDLYATFNAGWDDAGGRAGDQNRFEYTKVPTPVTAAYRQGLVDEALKLVRYCDEDNWPSDGRYMVITSQVKAMLLDYLIVDKPGLGAGGLVDSALQSAAFTQLFGMRVLMDNQLPIAAAQNNPFMLVSRNDAIAYARQIRKVEAYRPEKDFADALKALWTWGSIRQYGRKKVCRRTGCVNGNADSTRPRLLRCQSDWCRSIGSKCGWCGGPYCSRRGRNRASSQSVLHH